MPERLLIDLLKYTVDSDFAHGSDLAFAFAHAGEFFDNSNLK